MSLQWVPALRGPPSLTQGLGFCWHFSDLDHIIWRVLLTFISITVGVKKMVFCAGQTFFTLRTVILLPRTYRDMNFVQICYMHKSWWRTAHFLQCWNGLFNARRIFTFRVSHGFKVPGVFNRLFPKLKCLSMLKSTRFFRNSWKISHLVCIIFWNNNHKKNKTKNTTFG